MAAAETPAKQFAKLPVSTKIIILVGLLILTTAAYYSILHSSVTDEIEQAQQNRQSLQGQLAQAQELQRQFVQLRVELEARKPIDQQNLRVLPARAEIATVLQDLNRLAELSGLDIQGVQPQPEQEEEFLVRIPVNLNLRGRYHQLGKFFHNVSRLQRAINIENISIDTPTVTEEGDVVLTVSVLATTFRRAPEEAS